MDKSAWLNNGQDVDSNAGFLFKKGDCRTGYHNMAFLPLSDSTLMIVSVTPHPTVSPMRVVCADGPTCPKRPKIFQLFGKEDVSLGFIRRYCVAFCPHCAHYIMDTHANWDPDLCTCTEYCDDSDCVVCNRLRIGHTPQININANGAKATSTDEEDCEAGVDPESRHAARPTPTTLNTQIENRVRAAISILDSRGAVSVVLKELDDKDRALAKKNREIEMLKQKCDELKMQRDDVQARAEILVKEVKDRFFYCPVTLEEWQDNMLRGVCGHMMSLQAAQGMLRQQGVNSPDGVLRCPFCREESRFRRVMNLGDLKKAAQMVLLPLPEFVAAPDCRMPNSDSDSD